jgi:hypothetical protein
VTRIALAGDVRWRPATAAAHPHRVHFVAIAMRFVASRL